MAKIDKLISDILKSYKVDPREACWDCHGTWVIYHRYLERIADKAGITFDAPEFIHTDAKAKESVMLVTGHMGDKTAWSIGEAMCYNNKNSYPFAMAEKRGKDRVILKLAGLSGHVYSEEEADDFKNRPPSPPPRQVQQEQSKPASNPAPRGGPRPSPPAAEPVEEVTLSLDERINILRECLTSHPLVKATGGMSRADVMKATNFTVPQFNETIAELRENGKVELRGQKRGARWHWVGVAVKVSTIVPPAKKLELAPYPDVNPNREGPLSSADIGAITVSGHELDSVIDKVINSGVGFIDITNLVRELTGCTSAHQALEEGKLTQDVLSGIAKLA
tara:strand:- start:80 stop:1084 length:1005 start_codon:yes stop_codon:yes gene_type:complete